MTHPGTYEPEPVYGPPRWQDHAQALNADLAERVADDTNRLAALLADMSEADRAALASDWDALRRDWAATAQDWPTRHR